MSRHDEDRLRDIVEAIGAIRQLKRGTLDDGLVYDAIRVRLLEIGEAVKGVDAALLDEVPEVPWKAIARMRDHLAHRYSIPTTRSSRTSSTTTSIRSSPPCAH